MTGDADPRFCYAECIAPAAEAAVEHDTAVVVDACDGDDWTPAGPQVVGPDLAVIEAEANGAELGPGYPVTLDNGRGAYVGTPVVNIPDSVGPEEVEP